MQEHARDGNVGHQGCCVLNVRICQLRCGQVEVLHWLFECKMRSMLNSGRGMWLQTLRTQHILLLSRPWRISYEIYAYLSSLVR
jgi:hypothetical protein